MMTLKRNGSNDVQELKLYYIMDLCESSIQDSRPIDD